MEETTPVVAPPAPPKSTYDPHAPRPRKRKAFRTYGSGLRPDQVSLVPKPLSPYMLAKYGADGKPKKGPKVRPSEEENPDAVAIAMSVRAAGGSLEQAHRASGLSRSTCRTLCIRNSAQMAKMRAQIADACTDLCQDAVEQAHKKLPKANAMQSAQIATLALNNSLLITGQPTQISATVHHVILQAPQLHDLVRSAAAILAPALAKPVMEAEVVKPTT